MKKLVTNPVTYSVTWRTIEVTGNVHVYHLTHLSTMAAKNPQKRHSDSFLVEEKTSSKKQKPISLHPPTVNDKKYTRSELKNISRIRQQRYNDLLECARLDDRNVPLLLPTAGQFKVPMVRVSQTLATQVELLDIYYYLKKRQADLPRKLSRDTFGSMIGFDLPGSTLGDMIKREVAIRAAAKKYPLNAHYIVNRKHVLIEDVLYRWLQEQREENIPVNGKMIKHAADITYTVLCDHHDDSGYTVSEVQPSFSVSWFDAFKKRYRISYCQLHGEAGSVDLQAIEPELVKIRQICAQYTPDNIFNCDETGFYLQELDSKSYTIPQSKSGVKASRTSRVTVLFCINASGSSLAMSKTMESLRPLVIGNTLSVWFMLRPSFIYLFISSLNFDGSLILVSSAFCKGD